MRNTLAIHKKLTIICAVMHRLNWDDLQFLLAVADQGTLSGAARVLGVNHATVHRRVAEFEKSLGVVIFKRHSNGYEVASEAGHIIDSVRSIERSVQGLERSITGLAADIEGTARLTSTDSLCEAVLIGHIRNLITRHPGVQIDLRSDNYHVNLARLDADITVRPAKSLPHDLAGEYAGEMSLRVYATQTYLANHTSRAAADHRWLGVTDPLQRSPVGKWLEDTAGDQAVFRSNSFLTLRDAAQAGMGLAMLPVYLGDRSETLVRVEQFKTELRTNIWVAAHPDRRRSKRIQFLIGYFTDALSHDKALLTGEPEPTVVAS